MNNNNFAPPNIFLGSQLQLKTLSGCEIWTQSSAKYIDAAIKTMEQALLTRKIFIPTKAKHLFASGYHSDLDDSTELDANDTRFCQEMVGMLRWAVQLGRIDINLDVSLMSSHTKNSRLGLMNALIHIFFLNTKTN